MMPRRRCLDCPTLTTRTRCPNCERNRDRARGTRQQRGYDTAHDQARAALIAALPLPCAYGCGTTLTPATLVAAHVEDGNPILGWQAACAPCNERAKRR